MAEANPKVMEMVENELKTNPDVENAELFEKAKKIDKGTGKLTLRQFHARYPLQVKRRKAPKRKKKTAAKGRRRRTTARPSDSRDAVRDILTELVRNTAGMDGAGLVDLMASLDGYVDRVMKAAGK